MHKLFYTDLALVLLTIFGATYLYASNAISLRYAVFIIGVYLVAKVMGYIMLPYPEFESFIRHLAATSSYGKLSGFEIFKTTLVALLFAGFIFIDPAIWIIESILVVMMRVWGILYTQKVKN